MAAPSLNDINDNRADDSRASRSHSDSVPNADGLEGGHATGAVGVIDQIIVRVGMVILSFSMMLLAKECGREVGRGSSSEMVLMALVEGRST